MPPETTQPTTLSRRRANRIRQTVARTQALYSSCRLLNAFVNAYVTTDFGKQADDRSLAFGSLNFCCQHFQDGLQAINPTQLLNRQPER